MGDKVKKTCYFNKEINRAIEQRRIINRRSFNSELEVIILKALNIELESDKRAIALSSIPD